MSEVTTPNSTVSNPEVDQIVNQIWSDEFVRRSLIEEYILPYVEVDETHQVGYFRTESIGILRPSLGLIFGDLGESLEKIRIKIPLHLGTPVVQEILNRLDSVVDHLRGSVDPKDFDSYMDGRFEDWWSGDGSFVIHGWKWDYFLDESMNVDFEKEVTNG